MIHKATNDELLRQRTRLVMNVFGTPDGREFLKLMIKESHPVFAESQRLQDYNLGRNADWCEINDIINNEAINE